MAWRGQFSVLPNAFNLFNNVNLFDQVVSARSGFGLKYCIILMDYYNIQDLIVNVRFLRSLSC